MTSDELRAMTAQGPTVVMMSRDDMLKLLDELEAERALRIQLERQREAANAYGDEEHARRERAEAALRLILPMAEAWADGKSQSHPDHECIEEARAALVKQVAGDA